MAYQVEMWDDFWCSEDQFPLIARILSGYNDNTVDGGSPSPPIPGFLKIYMLWTMTGSLNPISLTSLWNAKDCVILPPRKTANLAAFYLYFVTECHALEDWVEPVECWKQVLPPNLRNFKRKCMLPVKFTEQGNWIAPWPILLRLWNLSTIMFPVFKDNHLSPCARKILFQDCDLYYCGITLLVKSIFLVEVVDFVSGIQEVLVPWLERGQSIVAHSV